MNQILTQMFDPVKIIKYRPPRKELHKEWQCCRRCGAGCIEGDKAMSEEETKSFLERCVFLLEDDYIVKYDERFWEE